MRILAGLRPRPPQRQVIAIRQDLWPCPAARGWREHGSMTPNTRADTPVRAVMTTSVVSIDPLATLRQAARSLRDADVGTLVIMQGPEIAGIVSERDLVRALAGDSDPDENRVAEVMSANPRYLTLADTVGAALEMMLAAGIRHLPVVDDDELVGIVSMRALANALVH